MNGNEVCSIYDDIHQWYDQVRGRELIERPYLDQALGHCLEGGSVLDMGCGSGEPIGRYLIEKGLPYTGVDGSSKMIDLCKKRLPAAEWLHADMRGLNLGRRFDMILAWDSFFHLSQGDQRGMFKIFQRHAAPSAVFLFTSGPRDGEVYGEMDGRQMYHASLNPQEYRELLFAHGFCVVRHVVEDPNCGGHTVWMAQQVNMPAVNKAF